MLRVFIRHSDPKVIAAQLGLSVNTIRDYLKAARRTLQVGRSIDAAHMLARVEGSPSPASPPDPQSMSPTLVEVAAAPLGPAPDMPSEGGRSFLPLPLPTKGRPWNDHPVWVRAIQIVIGLFCLLAAAARAVSGGEAVSRIARQML